jgi:hypothetical protein
VSADGGLTVIRYAEWLCLQAATAAEAGVAVLVRLMQSFRAPLGTQKKGCASCLHEMPNK